MYKLYEGDGKTSEMTFNVQFKPEGGFDSSVLSGERVVVTLDITGTANLADFNITNVTSEEFDVQWRIDSDANGSRLVVELTPDGKGADNLQGLPFDVTIHTPDDGIPEGPESLSFDIATAVKVDANGAVIQNYGVWETNDEIHFVIDDVSVINGTRGADIINCDEGNQLIDGGRGNDQISSGRGDDQLYGGTGDDQLFGGEGDDELYGNAGNDILHGGAGDDVLYGASEDSGAQGNNPANVDYLYGDEGNDLFVFGEFHGIANVYGNNDVSPDGGAWTDMIEIDVIAQNGSATGDWTLVIENDDGSIHSTAVFNPVTEDGSIAGQDMHGSITTDDGGIINFDDIDKIEW